MRRFFKDVTELRCIFCERTFPLDQPDFRTMNRHGWGCCKWCWEQGIVNSKVYIPAERIREMQNSVPISIIEYVNS